MNNVVLIGMAGVGKSTIGSLLAKTLGFTFIDLDHNIQQKKGNSLQDIIDSKGEEYFLELEKKSMLEIEMHEVVIAPGGSIIYHPELMQYLGQHATLVFLDDTFKNIEGRIKNLHSRGIVGLKQKTLRQVYEERKRSYVSYAQLTVHCARKSQQQIVGEIMDFLNEKGK